MIFAFHSGLNEIWRGDFAEATMIADDAMEIALQLDGVAASGGAHAAGGGRGVHRS